MSSIPSWSRLPSPPRPIGRHPALDAPYESRLCFLPHPTWQWRPFSDGLMVIELGPVPWHLRMASRLTLGSRWTRIDDRREEYEERPLHITLLVAAAVGVVIGLALL